MTHDPADADFIAFPGLARAQAARIRILVRTALAERGLETVLAGDALRALDGRVFGLRTVASACKAGGGEPQWPGIVNAYLDELLAGAPAVPTELTADQLRSNTYLRLVHLEGLDPALRAAHSHARPIGAGMVEMLVHREGDIVRWLRDQEIDLVGYDELRAIGTENLRRDRPDVCELLRKDGAEFHVVRGESGFVASKLLQLAEVIRIVAGHRARHPEGVLVSVPNRHTLAFGVIDATTPVLAANMLSYTRWEYCEGHAPLSPHLYRWRRGELTQLTVLDEKGLIFRRDLPELTALLDRPDVA